MKLLISSQGADHQIPKFPNELMMLKQPSRVTIARTNSPLWLTS